MRKLGLIACLCLITLFACDSSQSQQSEEEQFLATHQDALGVFTTTTGILTLPGGQLPANLSFEKVRAFYPVVCLDLDSDHDGIPDSFDLHFNGNPSSINPSALPHPCKRCNRGPGVNGDFRLHVMGTNVDLQRGRVSTMGTNVLSIPSPDGPITVTWTTATEIKDGPVGPGAEVRVRGTMTADNTIAADLIWVLCPGASMSSGAGGGAGGGDGNSAGGGTANGTGGGNPDGVGGGFVEGSPGGGTANGAGGGTSSGTGGGGDGTPSDPNAGGTTPPVIIEGSGPSSGTGTPIQWTPVITPSGQLDPVGLPSSLKPMPTLDLSGTPPLL